MTKLEARATTAIGIPLIWYLFGSFIAWDFNPALWDSAGRFILGFVTIASLVIINIIIEDVL